MGEMQLIGIFRYDQRETPLRQQQWPVGIPRVVECYRHGREQLEEGAKEKGKEMGGSGASGPEWTLMVRLVGAAGGLATIGLPLLFFPIVA
jgi:hypothetical protein